MKIIYLLIATLYLTANANAANFSASGESKGARACVVYYNMGKSGRSVITYSCDGIKYPDQAVNGSYSEIESNLIAEFLKMGFELKDHSGQSVHWIKYIFTRNVVVTRDILNLNN